MLLLCFLYCYYNLVYTNILTTFYILKEIQDGTLGLECRSCHRSFRNRRQILKHICLGEVEEDNDEENGKEQIKL